MKMKPIHFPAPAADKMVRALLDGRKIVTRRVVKPQPKEGHLIDFHPWRDEWMYGCGQTFYAVCKRPYRTHDILYVQETWAAWSRTTGTQPALYYKADCDAPDGIKWRPSIHMPREAARIFLRVTDVRVEQLQWCGNMEAKEEGCTCCSQFVRLWDSTIKPADRALYGWEANPRVWVIAFEKIRKEEAND